MFIFQQNYSAICQYCNTRKIQKIGEKSKSGKLCYCCIKFIFEVSVCLSVTPCGKLLKLNFPRFHNVRGDNGSYRKAHTCTHTLEWNKVNMTKWFHSIALYMMCVRVCVTAIEYHFRSRVTATISASHTHIHHIFEETFQFTAKLYLLLSKYWYFHKDVQNFHVLRVEVLLR